MQTLLAILLYMQLIQSPGTYTQDHIDQLEIQHHAEIQIIMNDPAQMDEVNNVYMPEAPKIVIVPTDEAKLTKTSGYFLCEIDNTITSNRQ
ncbi:MAG: hypothetical protein ACXWD4_01580 [Bacteroidia bacterium]